MLGELFGDEEEGDFGLMNNEDTPAIQAGIQTWANTTRKPAHCASDLNPPSEPRQTSNIVGLYNQ